MRDLVTGQKVKQIVMRFSTRICQHLILILKFDLTINK